MYLRRATKALRTDPEWLLHHKASNKVFVTIQKNKVGTIVSLAVSCNTTQRWVCVTSAASSRRPRDVMTTSEHVLTATSISSTAFSGPNTAPSLTILLSYSMTRILEDSDCTVKVREVLMSTFVHFPQLLPTSMEIRGRLHCQTWNNGIHKQHRKLKLLMRQSLELQPGITTVQHFAVWWFI
jgi:hypothetical protein